VASDAPMISHQMLAPNVWCIDSGSYFKSHMSISNGHKAVSQLKVALDAPAKTIRCRRHTSDATQSGTKTGFSPIDASDRGAIEHDQRSMRAPPRLLACDPTKITMRRMINSVLAVSTARALNALVYHVALCQNVQYTSDIALASDVTLSNI
jgi:hypothetical protein